MNEPSMIARRTVIVASRNKGKVAELRRLFKHLNVDLVPLSSVGAAVDVVEGGATFEDNARKKARAVAEALAMPALADDSGLEVDALGGRPGVRSARYGGEQATDAENNRKLLAELEAAGDDATGASTVRRSARFRCVLVLVDPVDPSRVMEASGVCEGTIATGPRGQGGFGYDPIFVVRDAPGGKTMAELSEDEKSRISHRARAAEALAPVLAAWLSAR